VKQYLAHQRQGTHKAKERAEIAGSTRKLKKQKGTGTARAGSIKSPVFRGGGRIFGPRPRTYTQKVNKNVKRVARRSALALKSREKELFVVEDFSFDTPRTKDYLEFLKSLGLDNKKSLLVLDQENTNVFLSSRNLPQSQVITGSELNTYKILNANTLVLSEGAVEGIVSNLSN
jgi:large subunit ribosomal protein L4